MFFLLQLLIILSISNILAQPVDFDLLCKISQIKEGNISKISQLRLCDRKITVKYILKDGHRGSVQSIAHEAIDGKHPEKSEIFSYLNTTYKLTANYHKNGFHSGYKLDLRKIENGKLIFESIIEFNTVSWFWENDGDYPNVDYFRPGIKWQDFTAMENSSNHEKLQIRCAFASYSLIENPFIKKPCGQM